jgi:large subunit ribosomal protein L16
MLSPKRTKFRKQHKGRIHGDAKGGTLKRQGRVWIRVFPDVPVSSKPAEVRMGSGKGTPEFWVAKIKPGRILFEVDGVPEDLARRGFELASAKLPIKTKFIVRIGE